MANAGVGGVPRLRGERGLGIFNDQVTIRGLGEEFAITTLNGRILPTDGTDRSFAFDVLPSEMISGASVVKAIQASALEGSIGGNIDLQTARPFNHKGLQLSGSVEGQYNDLAEKGELARAAGAAEVLRSDEVDDLSAAVVHHEHLALRLHARHDHCGDLGGADVCGRARRLAVHHR